MTARTTTLESPWLVAALLILSLTACAEKGPFSINLMPAPEVYDDEVLNPLKDDGAIADAPFHGILYVTGREPIQEGDKEDFYRNERGTVLRVGMAQIDMKGEKGEEISWEEARKISLAKTRSAKYPLIVGSVEEFGILHSLQPFGFLHDPSEFEGAPAADEHFADLINQKLAVSKRKDVFIYVHGYKVVFENPILVAAELWHFLGYDGVFIAYSWPSTPKTTAYFKDTETAELSGRNLRLTLEFLAENTDAERIHIVGYSAGTRVVMTALHQLALKHDQDSEETVRAKLRLQSVALVGSDYDRHKFAGTVADGLFKVTNSMSVYQSSTDGALGMSNFFYGRNRLGEMKSMENATETVWDYLRNTDELFFIDVSGAEGSDTGNGHGYFRSSPWASSDLLMTLFYGLTPAERGLVRGENDATWSFPEDYVSRLRAAIITHNPEIAESLQEPESETEPSPEEGASQ